MDVNKILATFSLASNQLATIYVVGASTKSTRFDVGLTPLLELPDFIQATLATIGTGLYVSPQSRVARLKQKDQKPVDELSASGRSADCLAIDARLDRERVRLHTTNLLTSLTGRWIDSVMIDTYLHVLQRHFKHRKYLYLVSAEKDPNFNELASTPPCFKYLLIPLYRKFHWTLTWINHPKKQIRYYNSQLPNRSSVHAAIRAPIHEEVREQLEPFKEQFPKYEILVMEAPQQCDNHSCGAYVAAFCYCILNDRETEIDNLKCWNAAKLRATILDQILLSFLYAPAVV